MQLLALKCFQEKYFVPPWQLPWKHLVYESLIASTDSGLRNACGLHVSPCEFGANLLPGLQSLLICLHGQDVFLLQLSFGRSVTQLDGKRVFAQDLLSQRTWIQKHCSQLMRGAPDVKKKILFILMSNRSKNLQPV